MKKLTILLLCLFLFIGLSNAQDNNSKQPLLKVTSFSTSMGFGGAMTANTDEDYYVLKNASNNPGLFVDVTGMENTSSSWQYDGDYSMGYTSGTGNGSVLFNLGLTPFSKKLEKYRNNREFRISVGGNFGSRNNFSYYDNRYFVIDTFQSVSGNELIYADSSIRKYYYYSLEFSEINFGLSYLFKTDVTRRFHFYTGMGVNYGIAIRSTISFDENTFRSVYYYNDFNKPSDEDDIFFVDDNADASFFSSNTNLKNPMQFVRAYLPIGISLWLSKKPTSFFNHVNLYSEWNPGVEFQMMGGEKTYVNPYIGFAFIGVRYQW